MAEGGGLLNRYTLLRRIEGSNPSVSAMYDRNYLILLIFSRELPLFPQPYPQIS